ncbi:hypothetical protein E8E13_008930 [Curvularia kusanoi]|uniref:ZN622/Rei1/Reh1 zinc finger C2H2-type domain-containing protein n=1 Tax=Curvularia kusanoi TaxID=90978 RepID=A0A9P4TBZ0_CURKU|nr:hypothetical protein E8E13_008930 [Curvularia kusanoi]
MAQRDHMKTSWHVYNLKRRIANLTPIPLSVYEEQIKIEPAQKKEQIHKIVERSEKDQAIIHQCLFCAALFDTTTKGTKDNINHMSAKHGLFIPSQDALWDVESFLGYLATQVRVWHECLYCGTTKATTQSIQHHMRDRDHCKLNFQKEPELSEFWERKQEVPSKPTFHGQGTSQMLTQPEFKQAVTYARSCQSNKKTFQARQKQLTSRVKREPAQPERWAKNGSCFHLVHRNKMGVQSLSVQQHHALVTAVKRSQKDEAIAKRAKEWSYAQRANDQKHDQAHGVLSWAKGGMHNLLPR